MTNFGHRGFKPFQEPDLTLLDFGQLLIFDDFGQKNTQPYIIYINNHLCNINYDMKYIDSYKLHKHSRFLSD